MKYGKKPEHDCSSIPSGRVLIEAFRVNYTPGYDETQPISPDGTAPDWLLDAIAKSEGTEGGVYLHSNGMWVIWTLEGSMEINPGDFVIRGINGELYPCRGDIFAATYDAID